MNAKYTLIDEAKAVVKKHFGDNVTIEPMIDEIVNHKDENISSKGFKDLFVGDQLKKLFSVRCHGVPIYFLLAPFCHSCR